MLYVYVFLVQNEKDYGSEMVSAAVRGNIICTVSQKKNVV